MFYIFYFNDQITLTNVRGKSSQQVVCQCDWCGKTISMKRYSFLRAKHHYCSIECHANHKRITFRGENNHQYGLRGPLNSSFKNHNVKKHNNKLLDDWIYVGEWYRGSIHGRVKIYRYLVEKHHDLYEETYFDLIDGWYYLKSKIEVHHIDFNHNNNDISNLLPLTKSEHVRLHNLYRGQNRDTKTGQFIKNDTKRISAEST